MKTLLNGLLFKNKFESPFLGTLLIIFCLGISIIGKAQNLVPNPSFESYTTCPSSGGEITFAFPWYGVTSGGSTDYFNTCAPFGASSVPKHGGIGYQFPRTGNGYAGIWMFSSATDIREYLQVQLTSPLSSGQCYQVVYYANLFNTMGYALSSVDGYFSTTAISSTGTGYVLNLSPQIKRFDLTAINDTVVWARISSIYLASGGEKYLTIGNFSDDLSIDTINTGSSYYGSYYYIDDVSVISIDSIVGGLPAFAGNDTTILSGDSVFVGQQITGLNCNWYDSVGTLISSNTSGIYVQPLTSTYYVVEQHLCGTITFDTINVTVQPVGINENNLNNSINVYPNPSNGNISIEFIKSNHSELNLKVTDITGRMVFTKTFNPVDGRLNFSLNSPNGIYMLFVSDPRTNESIVKRIVIQK